MVAALPRFSLTLWVLSWRVLPSVVLCLHRSFIARDARRVLPSCSIAEVLWLRICEKNRRVSLASGAGALLRAHCSILPVRLNVVDVLLDEMPFQLRDASELVDHARLSARPTLPCVPPALSLLHFFFTV